MYETKLDRYLAEYLERIEKEDLKTIFTFTYPKDEVNIEYVVTCLSDEIVYRFAQSHDKNNLAGVNGCLEAKFTVAEHIEKRKLKHLNGIIESSEENIFFNYHWCALRYNPNQGHTHEYDSEKLLGNIRNNVNSWLSSLKRAAKQGDVEIFCDKEFSKLSEGPVSDHIFVLPVDDKGHMLYYPAVSALRQKKDRDELTKIYFKLLGLSDIFQKQSRNLIFKEYNRSFGTNNVIG